MLDQFAAKHEENLMPVWSSIKECYFYV
jgi:hypothetical protein